ncbi:MAG: deoxyribodipyrimidine photo-lyase, partial [Saprospiraceae bacterium]|nr:deoxyribodipyrimidine photo-lyase [Saprospiraceae bacterium]
MKRKAIVWFRQDLRVHDNEALFEAINCDDELLAVYVFDDKFFKNNTQKFGFRKTGIHRTQFIIQAVEALREKLKIHGIDLIVRCGKTEDVIFELAKSYKSNWVYCNRESTYDEVQIQDQLELKLWSIGQELRFTRGKMLYYTQDLPFPITHTPDNFANFKKEVEKIVPIRVPLMLEEDFTI